MTRSLLRSGPFRQVSAALVLCLAVDPAAIASSKKAPPSEQPHVRATEQPAYSIPATPLGFAAPGDFYLGLRNSLASLDFLDEDHLLFTFRVPGLIHRDAANPDARDERRIRAIVLKLPEGSIEAETVWTVHDHARYLYMLDHGQYLVRDRNDLLLGDPSLQLKPFLHFPGPVVWVELDPSREYLVTGNDEPLAHKAKPNEVSSPASAAAQIDGDQPSPGDARNLVLRILRRSDGKVMLVSHVKNAVHLPLNEDGYLQTLRSTGMAWQVNFNHFDGGNTTLGSVNSVCSPMLEFVAPTVFLATTCGQSGEAHLVAMSTAGQRLWEEAPNTTAVWPLVIMGRDGTRMARESLLAAHDVNASSPLGTEDIKGQDVQIIDTATGKIVLRAAASPILDAGGNVAISPSDRRVAVLMDGNIQVFSLPVAPPIPSSGEQTANQAH